MGRPQGRTFTLAWFTAVRTVLPFRAVHARPQLHQFDLDLILLQDSILSVARLRRQQLPAYTYTSYLPTAWPRLPLHTFHTQHTHAFGRFDKRHEHFFLLARAHAPWVSLRFIRTRAQHRAGAGRRHYNNATPLNGIFARAPRNVSTSRMCIAGGYLLLHVLRLHSGPRHLPAAEHSGLPLETLLNIQPLTWKLT